AAASLGAGDVRITGPNGFAAVATAAAVADPTDGPVRTVVYTVPAPAAGWSDAGAATLAIQVVAGQVLATDGSAVPAGRVGQVAVATDGPSAVAYAPDVPPTLVGNHTFQVTYASPNPGLAATIDNNDLRVLGPAGYSQPATLASFFGDGTTASPLVATYTIPAPASGWASGANGTYNVVAQANQVVDANGNALPAGAIGQFAVSVDRSAPLATSTVQDITTPMSTARTVFINYYDVSGINQATLDSSDVRVTGPNGYDSGVTRTGTIATRGLGLKVPYALAAPAGGWKSRMNGTYTVTLQAGQVADTLGFVSTAAKAIGTINVALETVPPTVAVSAVSPNPRATAVSSLTLTFSEAVNLVDLGDLSLTRNGAAVSLAGATLTTSDNVTFTLSGLAGLTGAAGSYALTVNPGGLEDLAGNVLAVAGTTAWTVDLTPPTATASAAGVAAPGGTATITVSYADNVGLAPSTIDSNDLQVTGPNGYSALAVLQSVTGTGAGRTAVYVAPAPAGGWKSANNGTYTVALRAGQVTDAAGNAAPAAALATFGVALETTPPTAAFAAVTPSTRPTGVDAVTVSFGEPVTGFDASDLSLTRDGAAVSLAGATVSSADGATYTVSGLAAATAGAGTYQLALAAAGSGIVDAAGNAIAAGASVGFTVLPPAPATIANAGFESPAVGVGQFVYAPADAGWTFGGYAGITANGSGFSGGNPPAPEGGQVGFLQIYGSMEQTVGSVVAGTYVVALRAAQRAYQQAVQDFQVQVDGQPVATFTPSGTAYATYVTPAFQLSDGPHTIRLVGLDSAFGDNTALVDDVRLAPADAVRPTAAVAAVAPNPRATPVASVAVAFSEPVSGFDPSDLTLTRDGVAVDLTGATVSSADGRTYTVAGLSAATAAAGQYVLTVNPSDVTDAPGNPVAAPASTSWTVVPVPVPVASGVSPATVAGSPFAQTLTVSGTDFAADAAVVIRAAATGQPLDGVQVVARSATQVTVTARFGTAAADWTAEVTGSTGTSAPVAFSSAAAPAMAVSGTVAADGLSAGVSAVAAPGLNVGYAWSVVSAPAGATATFAQTRSATPSTTATFTAAGTYVLQATATDGSATQTGTVTLTVAPVLSNVLVTPPSASMSVNATQQFTAAGYDQFGAPMPIDGLQWAIYSGGGTIDAATGVYTAPPTASDVIVRAVSGSGFIRSVPIAVGLPTTFTPLKVDFVPATKTVATGYQRDGGSTYANRGNGYTYGWSISHTDVVFDRDKNTNQLVDTSVGVKSGARWQLAVPNGQYTVKVGIGDSAVATTNTVRVEGTTAYSGTALAANAFSTKTVTVTVSDGVLTIDSGSAANLVTRLTHVEVSPVTVPPPPPPFTSAKVDFTTGTATLATGYLRDSGNTYAARNGLTYGWNVSHTSNVYDRNKASSQLVDTVLVAKANAKWELAVPNGTYTVKVGVGDAAASSNNTVKVEGGSLFTSTALAANVFQTKSITVTVSDGRLTLLVGSTDLVTRLTHVEVTKV
ncbi:MAG TPA: Ig-like domain-containing protein, partial [Humisphaera sp.]